MDIFKSKCDHCGTEVETYFYHQGWIRIAINSGEFKNVGSIIYVENPEIPGKQKLKTNTVELNNSVLDFCCLLCLSEYIKTHKPKRHITPSPGITK